jgi:hypothetical protein
LLIQKIRPGEDKFMHKGRPVYGVLIQQRRQVLSSWDGRIIAGLYSRRGRVIAFLLSSGGRVTAFLLSRGGRVLA